MERFESFPLDPGQSIGGCNEVFRHPLFTEGSKAERLQIMLASARAVYEDECQYPWDHYFGRDLRPFLAGKRVLDLGCFTGGRAVAWFQRYGIAHISGTDTNEVFMDAARAFARSQHTAARFSAGRGEDLPYSDESFDAILSFDVFEHVQNPVQVLAECRRVLKPSGYAFIVFPGFYQPVEHHLSMVTNVPFIHYFFTPSALIRAYCAILENRGEAAAWYSREPYELESWERGHTINGLTLRRFRRLVRQAGLTIDEQVRRPLGTVGRRSERSRSVRLTGRFLRPLGSLPVLEEAVLHRGVFILSKS